MARVNICDLCKEPKDTDFRLSLFKRTGKKKEEKSEAEICEPCHKQLALGLSRKERFINFGTLVFDKMPPDPLGYISPEAHKALTALTPPDGVVKVPSSLTPSSIKKINKSVETANSGCKHDEKTIDDSGRVVCRSCKKSIED